MSDIEIPRLLRLKQIIGDLNAKPPIPPILPISKSNWWEGVKAGRYPKAIKIGLSQRNRLALNHDVTVAKTFDVDKDAYFRAIDVALRVVSEKNPESGSQGTQALSKVLASHAMYLRI